MAPFRARLSATASTALTRPSPAVTAYSNVSVSVPEPLSYRAVRGSRGFGASPRRRRIVGVPLLSSTNTSSRFCSESGGVYCTGPANLTFTRTVSPAVHAPPPVLTTSTCSTRVFVYSDSSTSPPPGGRIVAPRRNMPLFPTTTRGAPSSAAPTV